EVATLCSHGQPLFWGESAQCHIWAFVIVGPHPFSCRLLNVIKGVPVVLGQPFVANRAIKPLHICVLLWLTRLDIFEPNTAAQSPRDDRRAEVFRPVVASNGDRFSAPVNDLFKRTYHPFRRQREVHLNTQRLAIEVIYHVQQPDASAVDELVVHEIHRPDLVYRSRHHQRLRCLPYEPLARLDTQIQFQLAIDPVDALVVPAEAFKVTQVQKAQTESPAPMVIGYSQQPVSNLVVFGVVLGHVSVTRLANLEGITGQTHRDTSLMHRMLGHLATTRRPYHFFSSASCTISALSFSSTYILRSRAFSAS